MHKVRITWTRVGLVERVRKDHTQEELRGFDDGLDVQ